MNSLVALASFHTLLTLVSGSSSFLEANGQLDVRKRSNGYQIGR